VALLLGDMRDEIASSLPFIGTLFMVAMRSGKLQLIKLLLVAIYRAGSSVTTRIVFKLHEHCLSAGSSCRVACLDLHETYSASIIDIAWQRSHPTQLQEILTLLVYYDNEQRQQR